MSRQMYSKGSTPQASIPVTIHEEAFASAHGRRYRSPCFVKCDGTPGWREGAFAVHQIWSGIFTAEARWARHGEAHLRDVWQCENALEHSTTEGGDRRQTI
jgi:phage terminase large subunit GpA-like protein